MTENNSGSWQGRSLIFARYAALTALFCLPISKAAVNACLTIVVMVVCLNPDFWRDMGSLWKSQVVRATIYLLGIITIGVTYSHGAFHDVVDTVAAYRRLLFVPVMLWLFRDAELHGMAEYLFISGAMVTLTFSYLNYFDWIDLFRVYPSEPIYRAVVFQHPAAQSIFMVVLMALAFLAGCRKRRMIARVPYFLIAMLSFINIFFMLDRKTGQICALALALWALLRWGYKTIVVKRNEGSAKALLTLAAMFVVFMSLVATLTTRPESRLGIMWNELAQVEKTGVQTSTGQRTYFWKMALDIYMQHPIVGAGTGSFKSKTQELIDAHQTSFPVSIRDPHNQYVYFAAELGTVGLMLYLYFIFVIWRAANGLDDESAETLRIVTLVFGIYGLFNAAMFDSKSAHMLVLFSGILLAPTLRAIGPVSAGSLARA